jgi:hypothetical protein
VSVLARERAAGRPVAKFDEVDTLSLHEEAVEGLREEERNRAEARNSFLLLLLLLGVCSFSGELIAESGRAGVPRSCRTSKMGRGWILQVLPCSCVCVGVPICYEERGAKIRPDGTCVFRMESGRRDFVRMRLHY